MKKESTTWVVFIFLATFVVALMTDLRFHSVDVQVYDTYYVCPWWFCLLSIMVMFGLLRGLIYIGEALSERSRLLAILVSLVNGLALLTLIFLLGIALIDLVHLNERYAEPDFLNYVGMTLLVTSVTIMVARAEISVIRRLVAAKVDGTRGE